MAEQQNVQLTFKYRGLRSYIDLDLCAHCPRLDKKGCCGHYSPVFYLLDLAYLHNEEPELLELILSMPSLTVLDYSITVNKIPDEAGFICPMLDKTSGCRLPQDRRESVCRHFICSGVAWQGREDMQAWALFFDQLGDLEIAINQEWSERIRTLGLTLRDPGHRAEIYRLAGLYLDQLLAQPPALIAGEHRDESHFLPVSIDRESEWVL